MSFPDFIQLCGSLDSMLSEIRSTRGIRAPVYQCVSCGHTETAPEPRVSVRATILSLGRFRIADAGVVKELQKRWAKYRKEHQLDLYGKPVDSDGPGKAPCVCPPPAES